MQVSAVMTIAPVTIISADSLKTAFDLLTKHNVRELPVVENDRLIGSVTDRNLRQVGPSTALFRDMTVASAMSPDPLVISPETAVVEAAELLRTYGVNSLPVVQENRLVGIISVSDLLKLFIEQNEGAEMA